MLGKRHWVGDRKPDQNPSLSNLSDRYCGIYHQKALLRIGEYWHHLAAIAVSEGWHQSFGLQPHFA
jgi:hypothetical protein